MPLPRRSALAFRAAFAACAILTVVSCCTGFIDAGEYARNIEINDPDVSSLPDGEYVGAYTISTPPGVLVANRSVAVHVHIADGRYDRIDVSDPDSLKDNETIRRLRGTIIATNRIAVDGVSGATYSGTAFLKAVEDAVSR